MKTILVVDSPTSSRKILVEKLVEEVQRLIVVDTVNIASQTLKNDEIDLVIVEGSVDPTGPMDDGAEWALSVCGTVPVIVFSLTKYSFLKNGILYFDKIQGYQPLLDYVSKI